MKTSKISKQRLILISDLWGKENSHWINHYTTILEEHFDLTYYDSCNLGNIDKSEHVEDKIHQQFVNGGIEMAVKNLLLIEKEAIDILSFSIGGYIAWKACLNGLKIKNLYALSSTRLRYETIKPNAEIKLFYGNIDPYKPDSIWFKKLEIKGRLFSNETHDFYNKKQIAAKICKDIILHIKKT